MLKFKEQLKAEIMKIILTFIMSAFTIINLNAICAVNRLSAFPYGNTLKQNSIIIIEGYELSQVVVKGLNKQFPVYLVAGKQKIKLNVKEILISQYRLTQAILKPETNLKAGLSYTLVIDNLPQTESLNRWNKDLKQNEPIVYKVIDGTDTIKPTFNTIPKEIKKSLISYGCGTSTHVVFDCNVIDSSEYLIKATLKNVKTGNETTYCVKTYNGTIGIGHNMCSGAFNFGESDDYEIAFSIIDASGNFTAWTGDQIKFTKPTANNSVNDE